MTGISVPNVILDFLDAEIAENVLRNDYYARKHLMIPYVAKLAYVAI